MNFRFEEEASFSDVTYLWFARTIDVETTTWYINITNGLNSQGDVTVRKSNGCKLSVDAI